MPGLPDARTNAVDRYLSDWLRENHLPGASVAIVRGDELAYATGAGSRDLETNDPATPETRFGVGSVTKSVTALAIATLVDRGELAFDDPVTRHLDLDADFDATLHELLSHASGLPSLGVSEVLIARQAGLGEYGLPMADAEDFYHTLERGLEERLEPGTFRYCNSGYTLLGEVIEAVDGRPFDDYVEEEIFRPLGMARSTFSAVAYAEDANAATAYYPGGGESDGGTAADSDSDTKSDTDAAGPDYRAVPLPVREQSYAAGGLLTSVTDLARALRYNAHGELDGEWLVDEATLERLHAGHTDTPEGPYGYGWRRREFLDRTLVGHGGSIAVATAYVGFTVDGPEDDPWGVALACNAAPDHSLAGPAQAMLAAAMGRDPAETPFVARRRALERFEGRYESFRGVKEARVERDSATLRLSFVDALESGSVSLVPVDPVAGEFEQPLDSGNRRPVRFVDGEDGLECHVDRWRLHRTGPL